MFAGEAAGRVAVAGVVIAVILGAIGVPSWLFLVIAVGFGVGAFKYIQRETRRDVDGY